MCQIRVGVKAAHLQREGNDNSWSLTPSIRDGAREAPSARLNLDCLILSQEALGLNLPPRGAPFHSRNAE